VSRRLYVVRVTRPLVVLAYSESEAIDTAERVMEEASDDADTVDVAVLRDLSQLPGGWRGGCWPYGHKREESLESIGEWLKRLRDPSTGGAP